jgi:hypothetical protein
MRRRDIRKLDRRHVAEHFDCGSAARTAFC